MQRRPKITTTKNTYTAVLIYPLVLDGLVEITKQQQYTLQNSGKRDKKNSVNIRESCIGKRKRPEKYITRPPQVRGKNMKNEAARPTLPHLPRLQIVVSKEREQKRHTLTHPGVSVAVMANIFKFIPGGENKF